MSDEHIPGGGWENVPQDIREAADKVVEMLKKYGFNVPDADPVPSDNGVNVPSRVNVYIAPLQISLMEEIQDNAETDEITILNNVGTGDIEIRRKR